MEPEPETIRQEEGFDALAIAVSLMLEIRAGALATLGRLDGFPLATLTTLALDDDGVPLIFVSELSAHTRNLLADARFSLLLARAGKGDPLTHARVTLTGTAERTDRAACKARFLAQTPKAKLYAEFADFSLWRLVPASIHLVAGFGKAHTGPADPLLAALAGHLRKRTG